MDDLDALLNHEFEDVQRVAKIIAELKEGVEAGTIDKFEAKEIADDILQIKIVEDKAEDLDRKLKIQQAYDTLRYIIEGVIL